MLGPKVGNLFGHQFDLLTSTGTSTTFTSKKRPSVQSGPIHTMIRIIFNHYPIPTLPTRRVPPQGKGDKNLNEQKNGPSESKLEEEVMTLGPIPMKKDLECLRGQL